MMNEQLPNLHVAERKPSRKSPAVPEFLVERILLDRERWLEVTCQRGGCKRMFMVRDNKSWTDTSEFTTRPCPYCFKVGRVPQSKRRRA